MFKLPEGYSQEPFDDPEPLDEEYVLNALLGYNYLPNQKSDCDELPPVFSSISFTAPIAEELESFPETREAPFMGYDAVVYKLTLPDPALSALPSLHFSETLLRLCQWPRGRASPP